VVSGFHGFTDCQANKSAQSLVDLGMKLPLCCIRGSQSMKQVIIAFLHHLLYSLGNYRKVSGRGSIIDELCPALKAGFLLET
jgi:hypothetical protein